MEKLSPDILVEIMKRLDTCTLGRTIVACKSIYQVFRDDYSWSIMAKHRFGQRIEQQQPSWLLTYQKLTSLCISVAAFDIIWLDGRYWRIEESDESMFGRYAHLDSVCWFDMRFLQRGVSRGTYQLVYRYRHGNRNNYEYRELQLKAIPLGRGQPSITQMTSLVDYQQPQPQLRNQWLEYGSLSLLVVDEEFCDIQYEFVDHSPGWKSQLDFDSIMLIRTDSVLSQREITERCLSFGTSNSSYVQESHKQCVIT